jgi:hypothetical protein
MDNRLGKLLSVLYELEESLEKSNIIEKPLIFCEIIKVEDEIDRILNESDT